MSTSLSVCQFGMADSSKYYSSHEHRPTDRYKRKRVWAQRNDELYPITTFLLFPSDVNPVLPDTEWRTSNLSFKLKVLLLYMSLGWFLSKLFLFGVWWEIHFQQWPTVEGWKPSQRRTWSAQNISHPLTLGSVSYPWSFVSMRMWRGKHKEGYGRGRGQGVLIWLYRN